MAVYGEQAQPPAGNGAGHEIIFLLRNRALSEAGASTSADSEVDTMPAAFLASPFLDRAWRSEPIEDLLERGQSKVNVFVSLGRSRAVSAGALHRSNIRVPFRMHLYKSARLDLLGTATHTTPWTNPIVRELASSFSTFSSMPFALGPSEYLLEDLAARYRLDSPIFADTVYPGIRTVVFEFDISSGSNGDRSFLQFGMPFVGEVFRPGVNMNLGWEMGAEDRSETVRPESGVMQGRKRSRGRTISMALETLTHAEAFSEVLGYAVDEGVLGRVFVWAEPVRRGLFYRQAFLGTARSLPKVALARLEIPAARGWVLEETE